VKPFLRSFSCFILILSIYSCETKVHNTHDLYNTLISYENFIDEAEILFLKFPKTLENYEDEIEKQVYNLRDSANKFNSDLFKINKQNAIITDAEHPFVAQWQVIEIKRLELEKKWLTHWRAHLVEEQNRFVQQLKTIEKETSYKEKGAADLELDELGISAEMQLSNRMQKIDKEHSEILKLFQQYILEIEKNIQSVKESPYESLMRVRA
jgi:hypothetical protein